MRLRIRRDRFEIVFPQINQESLAPICGYSPQLARLELDRITMLRLFSRMMRIGVRKNEHAPIARDDAAFPANVTRHARVSRRINVPRAHPVTFAKARARRFRSPLSFDRIGTDSAR